MSPDFDTNHFIPEGAGSMFSSNTDTITLPYLPPMLFQQLKVRCGKGHRSSFLFPGGFHTVLPHLFPFYISCAPFFGMFTKLWKATISFIVSVRPSVHMEQLGSHWMDFHEIWYLSIFWKYVKKIQVSLKCDRNNMYFTWKPTYIYDISLNSSQNENCFTQKL
jgi:hypothetical protein